jgi:hypothetical protein
MTRTYRAAAVTVTLAAALLLSGCNPAQAGSAAIVGDVRISETRVNQAAADALEAASADPAAAPNGFDASTFLRQTTNRLITSELLAVAAAEEGITVSQAEIDAVLAQAAAGATAGQLQAQLAAQFAVPPSEVDAFVRDFILRQKLGAKLDPGGDSTAQRAAADARLVQVADEVGVTVSPRYGHWNAESAVIDGDLNDLSVTPSPAPEPSAATG